MADSRLCERSVVPWRQSKDLSHPWVFVRSGCVGEQETDEDERRLLLFVSIVLTKR
jgi:hypothetical protein